MANKYDIYNVLNSINAQANTGATLVKTSTDFISYGDTILSLSSDAQDTWFSALLDRIGQTVIDNRAYRAKTAVSLWRSDYEYGMAMSKLYSSMPTASTDKAWSDPAYVTTDPFAPEVATVEQRLYAKQSTWQLKRTIPMVQLKTAFLSEQAMGAFLDSLMLTVQNAMERSIENLANITRSSLIAKTYLAGGAKVVKLITAYYNETGQTVTAPGCLYNRDFLRFASLQIALNLDRIQHMTSIFAKSGYERFSDREYVDFAVLGLFDDSVRTYLAADTYHDKLVELPSENKYIAPFWQASGTGFGYGDISKVNLELQPESSGGAGDDIKLEKAGIIAIIHDKEAAGLTLDERRVTTLFNPELESTNYWFKARERYFVDDTQPAIVFTLE